MAFVFEIVADFAFNSSAAVLESNKIKTALDGISGAAEEAIGSVGKLGFSLASSLGLGGLGVLGGLGKSVLMAEKFGQSVNILASVFTSNKEVFEGNYFDTFNNRVLYSEQLMRDLGAQASSLGLKQKDLVATFKSIAFVGLQGGLQIEQIKNLARNVQVAAPVAGLDPNTVGDQIFRLALQGVGGSPTLFKTLLADTKTFQQFKGKGGTGKFTGMDFAGRVQVLAKAFDEFGNKPDVIARQINTLSAQFNILTNTVENALISFGDVFRPLLIDVFKEVNAFIKRVGPGIVGEIRNIFMSLMDTPREMFLDLVQLSRLSGDVGKVTRMLRLIPSLFLASFALNAVVIQFVSSTTLVGAALHGLNASLLAFVGGIRAIALAPVLGPAIGGLLAKFGTFGTILFGIGNAIVNLSGIAFLAIVAFQTLSRGIAVAKAAWIAFFLENTERWTAMFSKFRLALTALWSPFQGFIEGIGDIIGWILGPGFLIAGFVHILDGLLAVVDILAKGIVGITALFNGLAGVMVNIALATKALFSGNFSEAGDQLAPSALAKAFMDNVASTFDKSGMFTPDKTNGGSTSAPVVNHHGDVIINNDIREAFEPDRIAFTIEEQIKKSLYNPRSAGGSSFSPAAASVQGAR